MKIQFKTILQVTAIALALTSCFTFTSCSDDEHPTLQPTLPATGGDPVKEISQVGRFNTVFNWNFKYKNNRLVEAGATKFDADSPEGTPISFVSNLSYGDHSVKVENSTNEKINIQLNSENFIEKMTVDNISYQFIYYNGHLVNWHKVINVSTTDKVKYSATIEYDKDDLKKITYTDYNADIITIDLEPDLSKNNVNGLLPETISLEMGCLGLEQLYYAGLLGRPTAHLVKSLTKVHPSDKKKCYTLDFSYNNEYNIYTKKTNTILCNYNTPSSDATASTSAPISVRYKY